MNFFQEKTMKSWAKVNGRVVRNNQITSKRNTKEHVVYGHIGKKPFFTRKVFPKKKKTRRN